MSKPAIQKRTAKRISEMRSTAKRAQAEQEKVAGFQKKRRARGYNARPYTWMERNDPGRALQMLRIAANARIMGQTWKQASEASGISVSTLTKWETTCADTPAGANWHATKQKLLRQLEAEKSKGNNLAQAVLAVNDPEKHPTVEINTNGVETPEQLCDRYSVELARILLDTAFDPNVSRGVRKDSAKEALALGGHSPVNKSVVITAPIENKETARALIEALGECRVIRENRQRMVAPYTGDALQLPDENVGELDAA